MLLYSKAPARKRGGFLHQAIGLSQMSICIQQLSEAMSDQPKFTNRPNPKIHSLNGDVFYHSRANAVVAEICLYDIQQKTWSILLMQRGLKDQEFAGYWALPSGYLDWNETLYQAMMREVYEETGVWLPMVIQQSTSVLADQQPWRIADAPTGQKQNLAFHYAVLLAWPSSDYPSLSVQSEDPRETSNAQWVDIQHAADMNLAFAHQQHIQQLITLKSNLFSQIESVAQ